MEIVPVGDEGMAMMEADKASAMVVLPDSFTQRFLDHRRTEIAVVRNPAEGIKPEIVAQGADVVATYLDQASRLLSEEMGVLKVMLDADKVPASAKVGILAAGITDKIEGVDVYLFPPLVEVGSVKESKDDDDGPGFNVFGGLKNIQSQSCLVAGGKISDGSASLRIALPKQHLIEVVAAAMQIQQQGMKTQQKMMQNQQSGMTPQMTGNSMGGASPQTPPPVRQVPQNPLQSWVGKPAPEIKMIDLEGNIHRISRLKGKKVILDFWTTWCPPCKKAIPNLIKLAGSEGSDLVILGLSNESSDKLVPFAKETKMNYPVIAYNDKDLPAPYNKVTAIPTLFLIDSEGVIQDVLTGYHEPEDLQARLKKIK